MSKASDYKKHCPSKTRIETLEIHIHLSYNTYKKHCPAKIRIETHLQQITVEASLS